MDVRCVQGMPLELVMQIIGVRKTSDPNIVEVTANQVSSPCVSATWWCSPTDQPKVGESVTYRCVSHA